MDNKGVLLELRTCWTKFSPFLNNLSTEGPKLIIPFLIQFSNSSTSIPNCGLTYLFFIRKF